MVAIEEVIAVGLCLEPYDRDFTASSLDLILVSSSLILETVTFDMAFVQAWDLAAILPLWCIGYVRKWQLAGYLLMCFVNQGGTHLTTVHTI
jgi:hypothetical protein